MRVAHRLLFSGADFLAGANFQPRGVSSYPSFACGASVAVGTSRSIVAVLSDLNTHSSTLPLRFLVDLLLFVLVILREMAFLLSHS